MADSIANRALRRIIRESGRIALGPGRRLVRFDEETLLAMARRRTGLSDFGDSEFHEPLRRLLQSLESEAHLNLLGRIAARESTSGMLVSRLRLERDRQQYPEIARQTIRRPLFITGMPRSGSTLLHGLMAQDPSNRVPRNWETLSPSPPPEPATFERDKRIKLAERQIRWFQRIAPDFQKIHPVGACMPEECVVILSHSFLSFQFSSMYFVPSYQTWLDQQDLEPAYRYHYRFLQHLQSRYRGERWVLKAPPHLPGLRALFAVYPDAGVIMTHRDPLDVVASVASLHVVLRRTFSDAVDPAAVGPEVTRLLAGDIERGLAARDSGCAGAEQYLDVHYLDLLHDPIATVRRIYAHFDLPLKRSAEARMRRFLVDAPKDKFGSHDYSLDEFGLTAEEENERYRAYRDRFGL